MPGTRVASPDFCKVKDSKGQGESFCWRIDGENSLYRMSGAGCKFIKCMGRISYHQVSVNSGILETLWERWGTGKVWLEDCRQESFYRMVGPDPTSCSKSSGPNPFDYKMTGYNPYELPVFCP